MKFVRSQDLKPGMRLAKPIYNRNGVLLYERNSRITLPAITSIRNFGLIGIYILEPAEPVPPFTKEDLDFEQTQTVYMFKLKEIFDKIYKQAPIPITTELIDDTISRYGIFNQRLNFNQNLRSADDFIYKHAISTAILTALISQHVPMTNINKRALIASAFLCDFGYRFVPRPILEKGLNLTEDDSNTIQTALERGLTYLRQYQNEFDFMKNAFSIMEYYIYSDNLEKRFEYISEEFLKLSQILKVAETFDYRTAMSIGHEPESEIMAMKYLENSPEKYNEEIVSILAQCIHIIPAGASVDLSTKEKAVVLVENPTDYMKPLILRLSDNNFYDLSEPNVGRRIQIIDLMKTMDNRVEIDENTLKQFVADKRIIAITNKFRSKLQ